MNDKDIVTLFFERSQQAITELSQKYGKLCFHIALNILKCNEDAEECENDTYLKTWNSVPPDEPICLRAYVSRIVRNLALSQYRYNHRQMRDSHLQVYLSELQDCIPASQDVEASADDTVNSVIQAFLSTLDLTTKALFIQRYFYMESISVLSKKFGIKESNVSTKLNRTRLKLKQYLEREGYAMMPDERLLELIGNIPEEMLDEALNMKKICRTRKKRVFYISVAAACMVVLLMRFVPVGQVMAAQIRKQVERLLEELFPPKDIPMTFEGMEENIPHEIYGELSTETEEFPKETEEISRENVDKAGFAIYVDMDSFETTEEAECHIIRGKPIVYTREDAIRNNEMLLADLSEEEAEQKIQEIVEKTQEFYDNLPTEEIRITQIQEISVEDAAGEMREELSELYADVSDIMVSELPKGLYIRADEGTAWDCEVKEVYFVDNGPGGVFVITASYIVDATEGVGVRFHSMIETFRVLQSSDSVQILTSEEAGITTEAVK